MSKILVADDEHAICQAFSRLLELEGHEALIASSGAQAVTLACEQAPDAAFLDVRMPGIDGLEALAQIKARRPDLPVIIMTAHGTMETAMEAIRQGAFDYLGKPVEVAQVRQLLDRALNRPSAPTTPQRQLSTTKPALLGKSASMQEIFKLMGLLTGNELTVLISGESGVGKELVARGIHDHGPRHQHPFVAVNCAAIPEQLLESELFGHEKGAFTGATEMRRGRIDAAAGGTLFLDEIGELPPLLQGKLLRLLQERCYERLGSHVSRPVEARIIAATNRDLEVEVDTGRFRVDLYHRLNLVHLDIPPLRRRRADIPELSRHFLRLANRELGKQLADLEDAALDLLQRHDWPGNVRELEHTIKRAALLARGSVLTWHDLELPDRNPTPAPSTDPISGDFIAAIRETLRHQTQGGATASTRPFHDILAQVEQALVDEALHLTGGNQVAAARLLGINRTTLRKKTGARNTN